MASHFTDAYTADTLPETVLIPIGAECVALDEADWERLAKLGPGLRWGVAKSGGRPAAVLRHPDYGAMIAARVILGADERQCVSYRDGNAFDLRRRNLLLVQKWARHRRRVPLPVLD